MSYPGLSLEGQVALVTGSARGIGAALAIGLAQAGADVAVSDIPQKLDEARGIQSQIEGLDRTSATYALDVLNLANIRESVAAVVRDFGRLDILVNNAGIRRRQPALEVTEEDWDAVVDTNLKGAFFCAQAAARPMIDQGYGRIINISSTGGGSTGRPGRLLLQQGGRSQSDPGFGLGVDQIRHHRQRHRPRPHHDSWLAGSRPPVTLGGPARHVGQHALGTADGAGRIGGSGHLSGQPFVISHHWASVDRRRRVDSNLGQLSAISGQPSAFRR